MKKQEILFPLLPAKEHVSLYAGTEATQKFNSRLSEFASNKNAIYLPYDKELPLEVIKDIVKWCLS